MTCALESRATAHGFSLVELVIVVVIIGIVAAIAVPRMSSAAARARATSLRADLAAMNHAADFYIAEHGGLCPAQDGLGAIASDGIELIARLVDRTDGFGASGSQFGPYLMKLPANPFNGLSTVRIDGAPPGAGTHGWRYDSVNRSFRADDSVETAAIRADTIEAAAVEKVSDGVARVLGVDSLPIDDGK